MIHFDWYKIWYNSELVTRRTPEMLGRQTPLSSAARPKDRAHLAPIPPSVRVSRPLDYSAADNAKAWRSSTNASTLRWRIRA